MRCCGHSLLTATTLIRVPGASRLAETTVRNRQLREVQVGLTRESRPIQPLDSLPMSRNGFGLWWCLNGGLSLHFGVMVAQSGGGCQWLPTSGCQMRAGGNVPDACNSAEVLGLFGGVCGFRFAGVLRGARRDAPSSFWQTRPS